MLNKNTIIDEIYNFKDKELSADDLNYIIKIFEYYNLGKLPEFDKDESVILEYSTGNFYIFIKDKEQEIKIKKTARNDIFQNLKNGNFKMKITKKEAKNLADLIFLAYNNLN